MKNKKITRLIQGILLLTAVTTASPNAIHAATENDLREVMGIGRINKTALQDKTNALTDRLVREENYNELAAMLKEKGVTLKLTEKEADEEKNAYKDMINSFDSCDSASSVIDKFSEYDSYTYYSDQTSIGSMDAEYINTSGTKEKLAKLDTLRKIMKNKEDIGNVGSSMTGITNDMSKIQKADEESVSFATEKKDKIYAAFSGTVASDKKSSVTINSGQTISVTYIGVKSFLQAGDSVKQGMPIGIATGSTVRVSMTVNGTKKNILLAYGSGGSESYSSYLSENPWADDILDFSNVKDSPSKKKKDSSQTQESDISGQGGTSIEYDGPQKLTEHEDVTEDPFSPDGEK